MRVEALLPRGKVRYAQQLLPLTLRGFDKGWNVLDDDMNLPFKYATRMENCYPDSEGNIRVRQGFELFARCSAHFSTAAGIVDGYYFNGALIVVGTNGEILKVLGDATVSRIWDSAISGGNPWGATDFVSFEIFNGHLILCNGSDKPLDIFPDFHVEYLQDQGTSTNINVPVCKYVRAVGRFLCMAGDPLEPDRVHISARDAPGTWFGDPPPNDATRLDVGSIIPGATVIRGLMQFRGRLVVMYAEGLVFGELGTYDDNGDHTPNFDDGIEGYGSISHRAGTTQGDDALFMDLNGVPSIKRTVLSTSFKPERVSELVDPEIKAMLSVLSFEALENRVFSVYNREAGQFMLFVPDAELIADTTETAAFVYNYRPSLQQAAWARYRGMNFTCGIRTLQNNIFFGDNDGTLWRFGSTQLPVELDYKEGALGTPIEFDWELPWFDFGKRTNVKHTKKIAFDTRGASEFTVQMYVDNFLDTPALSMRFSGGEQGEYGDSAQPYGGGRNTSRKKHYNWPSKFEIMKLRFTGTADAGLSFVSISLQYLFGGINR